MEFIKSNDIGLPLAFFISEEIVTVSDIATKYVNETWDLFLELLGIHDAGFTSLDELLGNA